MSASTVLPLVDLYYILMCVDDGFQIDSASRNLLLQNWGNPRPPGQLCYLLYSSQLYALVWVRRVDNYSILGFVIDNEVSVVVTYRTLVFEEDMRAESCFRSLPIPVSVKGSWDSSRLSKRRKFSMEISAYYFQSLNLLLAEFKDLGRKTREEGRHTHRNRLNMHGASD